MPTPPVIDLGLWYRHARLRISDVVNEGNEGLIVPATPAWRVHDVLAHLVGITEDAIAGNMQGVTADPWTAAQVERGRSRSVDELIAIWETNSPLIEANLSSPEGERTARAVIDIHTHEADLINALGRPVELPEDVIAWAANRLRTEFHLMVAESSLPDVVVGASDLEWFRGRLGRRTVAEVCAYDWSEDPARYLDMWFVFGRAEQSLGES